MRIILFSCLLGTAFGSGYSVGRYRTNQLTAENMEAAERIHVEEVRRLREKLLASQRRELDGWRHADKIADLATKALGERR